MVMPDETRECPVTPQELREFAEQLGGVFWPRKIHALVDWLEQSREQPALLDSDMILRSIEASIGTLDHSAAIDADDWREQIAAKVGALVNVVREQPAVPSSTQPQELPLSERMRNWDKHNQPSGASNYADEVADLERRNAELLEHLKICVQRLYVHQGATTRKIVADAQSVIDAARGKES